MLWRLPLALLIAVAFMSLSQTEAAPGPAGSVPVYGRKANGSQFQNDNNLVDTLFQNFNGNDNNKGDKKKETVGPLPTPVSAPIPGPSATEARRRARAGRETTIFLLNDRVVVRVPASIPDDYEIGIQVIPTPPNAAPPGPVIGGLVFRVTADEFAATPPDRLPIEVNLSARYTDAELGARDESRLVLAWLDPADNTWKPAPKSAADPQNNYLSATIQQLGVYAVYQTP